MEEIFKLYNELISNPLAPKKYRKLMKYYESIGRSSDANAFAYVINSKSSPNILIDKLEIDNKTIDFTGQPNRYEETMDLLILWKKEQPHVADVDYYMAYTHLANKHYDKFLTAAEHFLFRTSTISIAWILTCYHYALVQLFIKNDPTNCIKYVIQCLAQQPTLAEFWCLLGDAFYKMKQYHRASIFYDNAIIFGSRRSQDSLPVEPTKYKDYPERMLEIIQKMLT